MLTALAIAASLLYANPARAVSINIGTAQGPPGGVVEVPTFLDAEGSEVAGLIVHIVFAPDARVALRENGRPDCTVNQAINKPASFNLEPPDGASEECSAIRVIVVSQQDVLVIPDGSEATRAWLQFIAP